MDNNNNGSGIWNTITKSVINLPLVKVDRRKFIIKELSLYCTEEEINIAIEESPIKVVDKALIDKVASGCIKYHTTLVCTTSAIAGIPGGLSMAGTIPADMAQFYAHVFALIQKLLYIYGWPDLNNEKGELDDETINILTIYTGVMFGSLAAINLSKKLFEKLAEEASKRFVRISLTKYAGYNILKQIVKWFGVKLTKDGFAKATGKIIPLIGAPVSGAITYMTFKPMAKRLRRHLDEQYKIMYVNYK